MINRTHIGKSNIQIRPPQLPGPGGETVTIGTIMVGRIENAVDVMARSLITPGGVTTVMARDQADALLDHVFKTVQDMTEAGDSIPKTYFVTLGSAVGKFLGCFLTRTLVSAARPRSLNRGLAGRAHFADHAHRPARGCPAWGGVGRTPRAAPDYP